MTKNLQTKIWQNVNSVQNMQVIIVIEDQHTETIYFKKFVTWNNIKYALLKG